TLLFPRDEAATPPAALGAALAGALLLLGWQQYRGDAPARATTSQAEAADRFRAATTEDAIYVRLKGAPFVFIHRAARHVSPTAVDSVAEAVGAANGYRIRFQLDDLPAFLARQPGEGRPEWLAELGAPRTEGGFEFYALPAPTGSR